MSVLSEIFGLMQWPLVAMLVLPWLLVYLGLHIVQRGIIFVDLALAQTAAFGTAAGMIIGYDVHDWECYAISLLFTLAGAFLLTFTRTSNKSVPQEALIGIVYIVAAAATVLVLSHTHGGKEELQRSLVGELLVVPPFEIWKTLGLYVIIGGVHYAYREKFWAISAGGEKAGANIPVRLWDFIFYMLFGMVVTSFVHIGGVLLAFSYLVVPAVCASFLATSIKMRFVIGWCVATLASVASLVVTFYMDLPIGAAVVCALGLVLVLTLAWVRLVGKRR